MPKMITTTSTSNADDFLNPSRVELARARRGFTKKGLAQALGITPVALSRFLNGHSELEANRLSTLANVLDYPESFLLGDDPERLETDSVSFRSLSTLRARERDAAIAAGQLGILLADWMDEQFNLPECDVPNLSGMSAEEAAGHLRDAWRLGSRPVREHVKLLESRGVRVFSLADATKNVGAFSFIKGDRPFVFLNNQKSAERTCFDAGHELGHLVLHVGVTTRYSKPIEQEADAFASAFLMPRDGFLARLPRAMTVEAIIEGKKYWHVSAMAYAYRAHSLGRISDWQYRSICIELTRLGYRTGEPNGMARQSSAVLPKVFKLLWEDRKTKHHVAEQLSLPVDEFESLVFGLVESAARPRAKYRPTLVSK